MNDSRAIWSLVCGILGLIICVPLAVVAIVLGNGVRREHGAAAPVTATIGVVLGWLAVVIWVIGLVIGIILSLS